MLRDHGWRPAALEYGEDGARVAHERGLATVRADATRLPVADASLDLVVAFDILEHIEDDTSAVTEVRRVLRPDATYLVAVPADPRLWSAHDEAVDHVRRYTRETLRDVLTRGGFDVVSMDSWNVLLRPVVAMRRRTSSRQRPRRPAPGRQRRPARGHHRRALPTGQAAARREPARHRPPPR